MSNKRKADDESSVPAKKLKQTSPSANGAFDITKLSMATTRFEDFFDARGLICIAGTDFQFRVHRVILNIMSEPLQALMKNASENAMSVIPLGEVSAAGAEKFFETVYNESITKFPAPKLETLTTAEMEDYQKLCQKYNVNPATPKKKRTSEEKQKLIESTLFACVACSKAFNGMTSVRQHVVSKQHEKAMKGRSNDEKCLRCNPCNMNFSDLETFEVHFNEVSHSKKKEKNISTTPKKQTPKKEKDLVNQELYSCAVCGLAKICGRTQYVSHLKGKKHAKLLKTKSEAEQQENNKVLESFGEPATFITPPLSQIFPPATTTQTPKPSVPTFNCDMCGISGMPEQQYQQHLKGKKHQKKLNPKQPPPPKRRPGKRGRRGTGMAPKYMGPGLLANQHIAPPPPNYYR